MLLAGVAARDITKRDAKMPAFNALGSFEAAGPAAPPESTACPVMAKALVLRSADECAVAIMTLDVVAIGSIGFVL